MSNEEEIKELEEQLENIRKSKREVRENFSHMPDVQGKILGNLESQERFLVEFIEERRKGK